MSCRHEDGSAQRPSLRAGLSVGPGLTRSCLRAISPSLFQGEPAPANAGGGRGLVPLKVPGGGNFREIFPIL